MEYIEGTAQARGIRIAGFRWSRDGQHLAVQEEETTSDVVLLTADAGR
jgi:hypothetical protein